MADSQGGPATGRSQGKRPRPLQLSPSQAQDRRRRGHTDTEELINSPWQPKYPRLPSQLHGDKASLGMSWAPMDRKVSRKRSHKRSASAERDWQEEEEEDDDDEDTGAGGYTSAQEDQLSGIDRDDDIDEQDEGSGAMDDNTSISTAGSMDLKERQDMINRSHPFGIRIWKPAVYKKNRSVQRSAEGEIHLSPSRTLGHHFTFGNFTWLVLFGWWMSIVCLIPSLLMLFVATRAGRKYSRVFRGLASYILYPFGQYLELRYKSEYAEEDEGIGRDVNDYRHLDENAVRAMWEQNDFDANQSSANDRELRQLPTRRRLFGRGKWSVARISFYALFYIIIAPVLYVVSAVCWFFVFSIPMSKVCYLLVKYVQNHPLQLEFRNNLAAFEGDDSPGAVLLCTYRAFGLKYYKFTVDGTNIFFINLMAVVAFTIIDEYALGPLTGHTSVINSPATVFVLALASIIPLAYFIGQAVASISAQSSMGMGAAINAFFGSIVEIFLYCMALKQGKGRLVEGSVIGSILAGVLLLPGLSMCAGAFREKTQRFNIKSAGVTSTMLLFAVLGCFAPTIFYQIYGTYELRCGNCQGPAEDFCQRCQFDQATAVDDPLYQSSVKPFTYICSCFLCLSYLIGLWFTLRTHAAQIWQNQQHTNTGGPHAEPHGVGQGSDRPQPPISRQASKAGSFYQSSQRPPLSASRSFTYHGGETPTMRTRYIQPLLQRMISQEEFSDDARSFSKPEANPNLNKAGDLREGKTKASGRETKMMRDVAIAAANLAVHNYSEQMQNKLRRKRMAGQPTPQDDEGLELEEENTHEAPNWGRTKSTVILLGATVLYAIIAEILVNTVDVVIENVDIDEKFLGFTLFALVPNTTEFMNAISFAMNGNVALSMEIGSAYALQVCLLQAPALVLFSAIQTWQKGFESSPNTFDLVFPRWDLFCIMLCVFLLSYVYGEGKSNYFKGSILVMSYLVTLFGFWLTPVGSFMNALPPTFVITAPLGT